MILCIGFCKDCILCRRQTDFNLFLKHKRSTFNCFIYKFCRSCMYPFIVAEFEIGFASRLNLWKIFNSIWIVLILSDKTQWLWYVIGMKIVIDDENTERERERERVIKRCAYKGQYLKDIDAYLWGLVVFKIIVIIVHKMFVVVVFVYKCWPFPIVCLMNDAFRNKGHIKMRTGINKTHYILAVYYHAKA